MARKSTIQTETLKMQITDSEQELKIVPLFRLGFRPFFLFGALLSIVPVLIIALLYHGKVVSGGITDVHWWHGHELVFGFAGAIVVGFLLTAAQNWTGSPGVRSWPLFAIFILWLSARVLLFVLGERSVIPFIFDMLWMPAAAVFLAIPIIKIKQWRNLFFVPLLCLLTLLNAGSYLSLAYSQPDRASQFVFAGLFAIISLIAVMGGRVIPFFTARGTGQEKVAAIKWLELISLIPLWLIVLCWAVLPVSLVKTPEMGYLFIFAGIINLIRFARFKMHSTLKIPLLWSLHLSYYFIPIGLIAIGYSISFNVAQFYNALHIVTIGGVGGVILAMIARVSLGHTGRMLTPSFSMSIAFVSILLSALIRAVMPWIRPEYMLKAYDMSATLWLMAFGLFVINYAPLLLKARVDGRPG